MLKIHDNNSMHWSNWRRPQKVIIYLTKRTAESFWNSCTIFYINGKYGQECCTLLHWNESVLPRLLWFLLIIASTVKSDLFSVHQMSVQVCLCAYAIVYLMFFQKSITMDKYLLIFTCLFSARGYHKRDILIEIFGGIFGLNVCIEIELNKSKLIRWFWCWWWETFWKHTKKQIIETNKQRTNFPNFRGDCYKLRRWSSAARYELVTLNLNTPNKRIHSHDD